MCAVNRIIRERVGSSTLVVEVIEDDICVSGPAKTVELARVGLVVEPDCPAGKALLELGQGTHRILIPELAARLGRRAMSELSSALSSFAASNNNLFGKAFVVSCTDPKWLLVTFANIEPHAKLFSLPPPPSAEPVPAPAGPAPAGPIENTPPPRDALVTGTCNESLAVGATVWVGRALTTGLLPGPSNLTTWTLGRTGNAATLVIQEFHAAKKAGPPDDEQPEATWACVRSTAWKGSVRGAPLRFTLSQGANGQQRELACSKRSVAVADAAARRVRVPSKMEGCNASRWVPAGKRQMQVLACVDPADDRANAFFLADRPGVEHVTYDNDDCGDPAAALRKIPRDASVSTAVKISEQPDDFVPAHIRRPR